MSLSLRSEPRSVAATGSSASRTRYAAATGVALAVALGLAYVSTARTSALATTAPVLITAVAAAVAAVVAVVVFVARVSADRARRHRRTAETLAWLKGLRPYSPSADTSHIPPAPTAAREEASGSESSLVRTLRLHVRALETVLEERTGRLATLERDLHARNGDDLERVIVTVGALRDRVKGEPAAEDVLDRVEAAISRLAVSPIPGRPVLPPRRTSSPLPPASAPMAAEPTPRATVASCAAPPSAAVASAPTAPMAAVPEESVVSSAVPQTRTTSTDDEVVLPVPAPTPTQPSRGRRRLRRRTAD